MGDLMTLGYLLWWKVGEVDLDYDRLEQALAGTGLTLPARPIPHDVFRRVTGSPPASPSYELLETGDSLEFSLVSVPASDKMLVRHIVGTVYDGRDVAVRVEKAGDMAFYYPPRGKNSKARMRVSTSCPPEWKPATDDYARRLRDAYDQGLRGALDGQAMRRLVRAHLAQVKALYLDGPYFVQDLAAQTPLRPLFDALGPDSFLHAVPLPDEPTHQAFLVRGLERAIKSGTEVDDSIWRLVE